MRHVKLPWELVEEILYRVHQPQSLIRFKIVCKQWKTLFETKSFVNNHLVHGRPQFLLWNDSKMYSVNVTINKDPKIEVRELHSEIPFPRKGIYIHFLPCYGLLFCDSFLFSQTKAVLMNPWLRQTRLIETGEIEVMFRGIGYDSGKPGKGLKIFGSSGCRTTHNEDILQGHRSVEIYKFETNEWECKCFGDSAVQFEIRTMSVSLNGNLYWKLFNHETKKFFIQSFNFSKEIYKECFCILPWDWNTYDRLVLSTFRNDRLSVAKIKGRNIEIWVTENKINIDDGENVKWVNFMTFSVLISPSSLSYFIDDVHKKSIVMCCEDEKRKLSIYIVRANVVKKIHIGVDAQHCSYVPSLIQVP